MKISYPTLVSVSPSLSPSLSPRLSLDLALGALITLSTFGSVAFADSPIEPKFRGEWVLAAMIADSTHPQPIACIPSEHSNYNGGAVMHERVAEYKVLNYIGSEGCTGDHTIAGSFRYELSGIKVNPDNQILRVMDFSYSYTIKGALAVAKLNDLKVCGHDDWQEKTYESYDPYLHSCTEDNSFDLIGPYMEPDGLRNTLSRFSTVGKGMSVETRDESDPESEFEFPTYLSR